MIVTTEQSQPHDAELVRGAQSGDQMSLGLLLDRHQAAMHAVALHVLGNGADAEDAVQDSVLMAMSKISELRDPAAVGGWLRAITWNCCLMRLRARHEVPLPRGLPLESRELTPEAVIDRHALRDWVWHAIEELSPPLRLTVMLRYFSDVSSYEQIAAACEVPIGTVRSRLSQARGKLASALAATADQAHADAGRLAAERRAEGVELLGAADRGHFASALGEHCPPAVTWLMNLRDGGVHRLRLFHARREQPLARVSGSA